MTNADNSKWTYRTVMIVACMLLLVSMPIVGSVAAANQTGASAQGFICEAGNPGTATFLGDIIQTFLNFVTLTGVPVFILLYQMDGVLEFFALGADTKQAIKQHQRNLWIASAKIYLLPTLIYFTVDAIGIANPQCINLVSWI